MNGTVNGEKPESNQGQITVIVRTLAVVCVLCVLGIFTLIYFDKNIPTELWLLTSNAMTALTAMLVKTTATITTPAEPTKPTGETKVPEQKLETAV